MDMLPTQVCENYDFISTQKLPHSSQYEAGQEAIQIGVLNVGSNAYPIKRGITKIGRHRECNIVLYDQTVSKVHAEIEASSCETSVWICDLNSSNKTKLNNSILRPGRCYELKDGSVIEFGMVRAIYKLHYSMDDSMIPETPAPPRQMKLVIPGTPDSSMNNSSALEGNDSVIPSTQGGDEKSVFRRPCIPQHNYSNNSSSSSNIKKTIVHDFSTDDNMDDSSNFTKQEKENVAVQRVSIHDMDTQKSFESQNETDIHDVETQKICTNKITTTENLCHKKPIDIHDMETQHDQNLQMQGNVTDIHEMETQYDIGIHDVKPSRAIGRQNVSAQDAEDSIRDVEKHKTEKTELPEDTKSSDKMNVQNIEAKEGKCCSNNANIYDDKYEGNNTSKTVVTIKQEDIIMHDEQTEDIQKASQGCLQLSLSTNFEDDCSELDKSHNLLGSQNLLEDLIEDDDVLNKSHSKTSMSIKSSCLNNNETTEKSTDDESIFDAATQVNTKAGNVFKTVTQSIEYPLKAALVEDDSDDTDQECLFQRYSRIASQDSQNPSKSQSLNSEDSDTDEEGQFTEIAVKEKRACFEARQNANKEVTSGDSDDLFEMPTQQINRRSKNSLTTVDVDFDAPTQVIKTKKSEDNTKVKDIEIDDLAATQILQTIESSSSANKPIDLTKNNAVSTEKDITEMDDNMPTQIMNISETVPESGKNESPSSDLLNPNSVDGNSDKDIDYEMAPTQLISEVDKSQSVPNAGDRKNALKKLKETNLNDTLEQNLNDMFEDVNEDDIEDQSLMSTQVLTNILQSSQHENKSDTSNVDSESPANSKVKESPKGRKRKTPLIDSISHSTPRKQNRRSNLKNTTINDESQNAGNYIANLTSTQKQNILLNSQGVASPVKNTSDNSKEEEHETMSEAMSVMNNKNISVCETLLKSTPKRLPVPRSLARNKNVESEVSETITERTDESKNNKDMLEESSKTDNQVSITSVNTRQSRLMSLVLNNDDDILAGLPEVRISGTLSNPASPTTPISKKRSQKKAVSRKKQTSRKSTRKLPVRGNAEDAEPCVSELNSSPILGTVSRLNGDKASTNIHESDDERITESSKQSTRKIASETLHKSKKKSLSREKSISAIDLQEQTRIAPIQSNRMTRNSSKENVDNSSIFQVQNEDLIGNTVIEPAQRTTLSSSRLEKKSLNSADIIETSNTKKRKGNANKSTSRGIKGRKSTARNTIVNQNSTNIHDYVIKQNSPVNVEDPCNTQLSVSQENLQSKQLVIKIMKISHNERTDCLSPSTPNESIVENNNMEIKQTRRTRVNKRVASNNAVTTETEEAVQNVRTRGNKSQKVTNRQQYEVEIVCSQSGEESQEVEMIMNASLKDQSTNLDTHKKTEIHEKISGRTRNTRKREATVIYTDEDSLNSNSSDLVQFDNEQFQRPSSKAKRAKTLKNSSNITNIPESEPDTRPKTNNKRPFKLTRGSQQSASDSSMSDHLETNNSTSFVKNTSSKVNSTRSRGRQPKAKKLKVDKKQNEHFIEDSSSSEMNSSVDNTSILSTPTRLRRSMSSSLSASSPLRVKHKILFTGITNDYSKLLSKLGASQVEDASKCDVLVTDKVRRTVKFLCALAQSVPIVSIDWLIESEKVGHFVELKNYILKDPVAEAKFGFKLRGSLEKAKEHKLLEGYTIILTPNVAPPPLPELKSIISSCGGKSLVRPPSSWPRQAVIISRVEDLANAKKFLTKAPKTVTIQSTEFLLTGILRQELNFDKLHTCQQQRMVRHPRKQHHV
ncbi:mutator 2 [Colletes latitarsis]|uniref:mutator 2 n=1 Tax=Colletes latitarsis TaxID=2605962 RepID=UPI004035F0C0